MFHKFFLTFLTGVELRHFFLPRCLGVPRLCNLYLQQYSLLYIQTLHDDCSQIEDVHLLFCAHLINIFLFLTGVELRHFFLLRCLGVPSLCNL